MSVPVFQAMMERRSSKYGSDPGKTSGRSRIITIGSDAHNADRIGDCVMESQKILKDIGFDGIYTFEKMKPEFHRF